MTRTTQTFRTLLGAAALAVAAAAADAQPPQSTQDTTTSARRTTSTSAGTVARERSAARRSARTARTAGEPRAHPRDYYGADDPRCDDLCQRERMMDEKYGKDRERLPAAARNRKP